MPEPTLRSDALRMTDEAGITVGHVMLHMGLFGGSLAKEDVGIVALAAAKVVIGAVATADGGGMWQQRLPPGRADQMAVDLLVHITRELGMANLPATIHRHLETGE